MLRAIKISQITPSKLVAARAIAVNDDGENLYFDPTDLRYRALFRPIPVRGQCRCSGGDPAKRARD